MGRIFQQYTVPTESDPAWAISGICHSVTYVCVYACVRALKGKRLELSTPNLVHASATASVDPEVKTS